MKYEESTSAAISNFTSLLPDIRNSSEKLSMSEDSLQDDEDQLETLTDLHNSLLSRSIFFLTRKKSACFLKLYSRLRSWKDLQKRKSRITSSTGSQTTNGISIIENDNEVKEDQHEINLNSSSQEHQNSTIRSVEEIRNNTTGYVYFGNISGNISAISNDSYFSYR